MTASSASSSRGLSTCSTASPASSAARSPRKAIPGRAAPTAPAYVARICATSAASGGAFPGLLPWPKVDFEKFGAVERKELSRIKKISGANLHRNWVVIPHVTNHDDADITELEVIATGEIGAYDTSLLTLSAMKGFFGGRVEEQVTYVNAPQVAERLGVKVKESKVAGAGNSDYVNLITLRAGTHSIAATLVGPGLLAPAPAPAADAPRAALQPLLSSLGLMGLDQLNRNHAAAGALLAVPALRKDGTRISIEFTIVPFRDAQGRMLGIAAVLRDVTARFEETRALRKALQAAGGG